MSTIAAPAKRHALGLPAGSIRSAHVLAIVGLVCAIILIPANITMPPYLIYLLFIMLGHYFAAHGVTISTSEDAPRPLFVPGSVMRFLIIVALVACVSWKMYQDEAGLKKQFEDSLDALKEQPFLPLAILGASSSASWSASSSAAIIRRQYFRTSRPGSR